jgi:hypothetical protein
MVIARSNLTSHFLDWRGTLCRALWSSGGCESSFLKPQTFLILGVSLFLIAIVLFEFALSFGLRDAKSLTSTILFYGSILSAVAGTILFMIGTYKMLRRRMP